MAYGTAPHKDAQGRWVTQQGRVLTPAGQAYWEHHHQQGYVTRDGHTTQKAKSTAFGGIIDPTRNRLPAPPPPPRRPGQPTITPGQWKGMTPKQKMDTQVTVTLSAHQREQLEKLRAQAAVRPPPPKGYRYTTPPPKLPPIPTHINRPIGFGGAAGIDTTFLRQEKARQAAWLKAHPPQPTQLETARAQMTAQGQASFPKEKAKVDAYNAAHRHDPNIVSGIIKGSVLFPAHAARAAALDTAGLYTDIFTGQPANQANRPSMMGKFAKTEAFPSVYKAATGKGVDPLGIGLEALGVLPFGKFASVGGKIIRRSAEAARTAEAARAATTARAGIMDRIATNVGRQQEINKAMAAGQTGFVDEIKALAAEHQQLAKDLDALDNPKAIQERQTWVENWKRSGMSDERLAAILPWYDNQAAKFHAGPQAWWREKIGHPTGQTVEQQAASGGRTLYQSTPEAARLKRKHGGGGEPIEAPTNFLKRELPPEQVEQNLRYVEGGDLYNPLLGNPEKNGKVFRTLKTGERVQVLGKITDAQRYKRLKALVPDAEEGNALAYWYNDVAPTIHRFFGEDAPAILRGFAVSQANDSPTGGIQATLRVLDKVKRGETVTKDEISAVSTSIQTAVKDEHVTSGMAAKLHDFTDAIEKKTTRTWMGDNPRGGAPYPNDVHMIRADGFVDPKIVARLREPGPDSLLQKGIPEAVVDSGGSPTKHQYERMRERGESFTRYVNEQKLYGRSDWTPAEVQALEWSAIQRLHGVVPDDLVAAITRGNARRVSLEVTKGASGIGQDLTLAEARQVAREVQPAIEDMVDEMDNLYLNGGIEVGVSASKGVENASLHFDVIGSPEETHALVLRLAHELDQVDVWATRSSQAAGAKPTIHITSPELEDPEKALALYRELHKADPKRFDGFTTAEHEGVPGIEIVMKGQTVTLENLAEFETKFQKIVDDAIEATGSKQGGYNYWADNTHRIDKGWKGGKGKGNLQRAEARRSARALDDPHASEVRGRLEAAVAEARGEGAAGELAPGGKRTLYQRDPASSLPKGATEFLKDGRLQQHYFPGADVDTAMHELLHVSIWDLKGRHLETLADEFAGGKLLKDWTDAEHEAVADAFEQWLRTGEITNEKLRGPFQAIKDWMNKIVGRSKDAGFQVPKDVEDAFNHMFSEAPDVPLKQQVVAAARKSPEDFAAQDLKRSVERSERFRAAAGIEDTGMAGHRARLEAMAGEYPRDFVEHLTHLTEDDMSYLSDLLYESPKLTMGEKMRVMEGIRKAAEGEILTPSVSRDILKAWAPKGTAGAKMTARDRAIDLIIQIANIPRSFMSTLDASGVLRQGLVAVALHPVMAAKLMPHMFKYGWSEKYYVERMFQYEKNPRVHLLRNQGMEVTDIDNPLKSEEAYQSQIAEKITGGKHGPVRRSARMYTGFLNDMRVGTGLHMLDVAERQTGFDRLLTQLGHPRDALELTPKNIKDIAKVANWTTGRGNLGKHEQAISLLNLIFFSPRLLVSRLQAFNPIFYASLSGPARRTAVRAAVQLVVAGTGILEMAKLAGLDVGVNPTSSDFGKIKVGNTTIDVWGGHQSAATMIMRTVKQETTNVEGETRKVNIFEPFKRYWTGKLSPLASLEEAYRTGHEYVGTPFTWSEAAQSRLIPFIINDARKAYGDTGDPAFTALIASLSAFGVSTNTFPRDGGSQAPSRPTGDPNRPDWSQMDSGGGGGAPQGGGGVDPNRPDWSQLGGGGGGAEPQSGGVDPNRPDWSQLGQ